MAAQPNMAVRPGLQTQNLPSASPSEVSATASPARGKEMRANLLSKLRPPPLVHQWEFWHDRQEPKSHARSSSSASHGHSRSISTSSLNPANSNGSSNYEDHLTLLHTITDVRSFWNVFNNFDVTKLPMRDSVHLFHKGVKPVWEDPRNERGGCWTFRVPKEKVQAFWQELCLMAVGEKLQDALAQPGRSTFIDDICGLSLSVRFTSTNIGIWNRDAEHSDGIQKILNTVLENLPEDLKPKESAYYYKKHFEHKDFSGHRPTRSMTLETPIEEPVEIKEGFESSQYAITGGEKMDVVMEAPPNVEEKGADGEQ